eukprot:Amastigsp_a339438_679.p3 type:complete len:123 gc:universal Amastigsp_a339438_679:967-599(-)
MMAGEAQTTAPASSSAAFLEPASPLPPETMAPACPMRRPGGAVTPAMNETMGFEILASLMKAAASSSATPPISPIRMMPSVSGSSLKIFRQSMKFVPLKGSPPMPTQRVWPSPTAVVWATAS